MGLAIGDVLAQSAELPPTVCTGAVELPEWGSYAERSFLNAERLLNSQPLDMDVSATDVVASSIALADPDASPPLLVDPDAVLMCSLVRDGLLGQLAVDPGRAAAEECRVALESVTGASTFASALDGLTGMQLPLAGAVAGLRWGPAAIPAAWITTLRGPVGTRNYSLRQLRRLGERLMQQAAPVPPEPRRSLGPREVAPGLWLSNLHAVPRFLADHPDGAVLSLCPTTGAFDAHPFRREFAVHDAAGSKVNPLLAVTVDEVLDSIAAFHHEDRHVLVHCHHGASRTGLILRAWLMRELDLNAEDATTEAQVRWPKTSTWNNAFSSELRRRERR